MLTSDPEQWLRNYKRKCVLGNCIFYFLKLEKVLLLILTLFFLSIFNCLTSASETLVNMTLFLRYLFILFWFFSFKGQDQWWRQKYMTCMFLVLLYLFLYKINLD